MGTGGPKISVEDWLAELEDAVKDAIVEGRTGDRVLEILLEITLSTIADGRPLFLNPLEEPVLYRHFRRWTTEGLEELAKLSKLEEEATSFD
jgi:hypothetical protein